MSERDDQKRTLLLLSDAFAPLGLFWTCDVGSGVPLSSIKALPERMRVALARGGFQAVLDVARRLPVISWGIVGGSDIQGCLEGRWIGIEKKTATGRQRESQKTFQRNIARAGGVCFVGRNAEDDVEAVWNIVAPTAAERSALEGRIRAARDALKAERRASS